MSGYSSIHWPSNQKGAVIMIMLLILVLGSASFLLTKLSKGDSRQPGNIAATTDMSAVTDALIGYALINGQCLPCPDTSTPRDGIAETTCGSTGVPDAGTLPWLTLGLGGADNWGRRLRYIVDTDFTNTGSGTCSFTDAIESELIVKGRDNANVLYDLHLAADRPPAIVIMHGNNGFGGTDANDAAMPPPPANHVDEETNRTDTNNLVQRVASDTAPAAAGGPFDDLVGWVDRTDFQTQLEASYGYWPP